MICSSSGANETVTCPASTGTGGTAGRLGWPRRFSWGKRMKKGEDVEFGLWELRVDGFLCFGIFEWIVHGFCDQDRDFGDVWIEFQREFWISDNKHWAGKIRIWIGKGLNYYKDWFHCWSGILVEYTWRLRFSLNLSNLKQNVQSFWTLFLREEISIPMEFHWMSNHFFDRRCVWWYIWIHLMHVMRLILFWRLVLLFGREREQRRSKQA